MSETVIHNPRLALPSDVLPINPYAIMLDGVAELDMGRAVGFWTPTADFCDPVREGGWPLLRTALAGEIINQLAAYVVLHGQTESRVPHMTENNNVRWLRPVIQDELLMIHVDVNHGHQQRNYFAQGQLVFAGEIACRGAVAGVLLDPGQELAEYKELPRRTGPLQKPNKPNPLYTKLVAVNRIPKLEVPAESPKVAMSIEDDNTIILDDKIISLQGHRLFILNALLLNLGRQITRHEIEKLGFSAGNKKNSRQVAFSGAKSSLQQRLIYGQPPRSLLLQEKTTKRPNVVKYQLDPNVEYTISDRRKKPSGY